MAAGAPTRALHQAGSMIFGRVPDRVRINLSDRARSLEMTPQTQVGVTGDEHFLVHGTVWAMAGDAAFFHRAVFKDKGTFLRGMTFGAGFVLTFHRGAHAFDGVARVYVVAIDARDPAREDRVGIG